MSLPAADDPGWNLKSMDESCNECEALLSLTQDHAQADRRTLADLAVLIGGRWVICD